MPRILFDLRPCADHGGVSRVTERLLAHLKETRVDTEIVTITTGVRDQRSTRNDRFGDIHIGIPNKLWSLFCFLGITSLDRAAGKQFDELILPNVAFVGTPKIPYTIVVHDLSFLIEPKWFSLRMRIWHHAVRATRLIQNATHIWCVSQTTAQDVKRILQVPSERITVLPSEIIRGSVTFQNVTNKDSSTPPYVIAFSGSKRKNAATAIAAVARVKEDPRFADLRLLLIGEQHPHPEPWITSVPFLTEEELHEAYAHASALLYPSWYEGFGLPLHEAAAQNIPCLASAHGALTETAPPGTILIPPAKPHLWATALCEILAARSAAR